MAIKRLLFLGPEIYLLLATIYYWTLTANPLNPIAITLTSILIFQLTSKNFITGLLISSLFIALNLYLILALISELSEFTIRNNDWNNLLIVGSLFIGFNLLAGAFMFYKYIGNKIIN